MIRKILAINGGGVEDVAYLTYMLKLSKHYDKKNIDLLSLFNTFSGVSSGSMIAAAFALRENFLQNIAKCNPDIIVSALKKINAEYSKNEILNIVKNLKKMTVTNYSNYSSIVIATLVVLLQEEASNIFNRSTLRKIASINGLLFSKYSDNKKHVLDKYFDFTLKDVPVDRTLVIKSINIKKIKVQIYTNYITSTKNDFLVSDPDQSVSEAVDFSSNAPVYFPFNKMIDGGTILNTSLLEQIFIFKNDDLVIFKLSDIIKPYIKKNIVFDGILGWAYPLFKIGILDGYENAIFKDLLKFKYQEKIHISEFDFTKYKLDDINKISEIENIGKKKSVKSALKFIDNILMGNAPAPLMRSGIVLTHINPAIRPQDDLFRFMNGKWLTESKIPEDRESDGTFYQLIEDTEKKVKQIIIDQVNVAGGIGSNAQKIGDLYNSFMDENKIEELGITPIAKDLTAAQGFNTKDEFIKLLGELININGPFDLYVNTDEKEANKYIVYLSQSGLSLPDEAYYREDKYKEIRDSFLVHVKNMFELAGLKDAQSCATSVLELETQIAAYHWDVVKNRDADLTYNKKSFTQLSDLCPAFNWPLWMKSSEIPEHVLTQVVVMQPSYFEGLSKLLDNFEVGKWRCWLTWRVLSGATPYLNSALVNERFNFYGTTLSGKPKQRERWKRATELIEKYIGEAVGQIYIERHFGKDAKERMVDLVKNLTHAYRVNIGALARMSDDTKKKALLKLDKFTSKIGYPDKWRDYSKLSITPGDLFGNVRAIAKYSQDYEYSKIGKEVDKSKWYMTPQTVNAYYNPGTNDIVFPAAILQPPFFDVLADDAANYGGIGAIIGHEIGHGFDDQGSKYDGDGNLVNWWNDQDRAEFEKLTSKLIKQYDQLSPENAPDIKVNGALTIGENISDLGGLAIAYKAYKISLNGKEPPVIDGYSGVQRFFMGYAQCWRVKYRPENVRRMVATDQHSPAEFRCNQIVSNMTEFYDAFEVTQNDKHFMAEDQRVRIW
jgi:putative endopeptidase